MNRKEASFDSVIEIFKHLVHFLNKRRTWEWAASFVITGLLLGHYLARVSNAVRTAPEKFLADGGQLFRNAESVPRKTPLGSWHCIDIHSDQAAYLSLSIVCMQVGLHENAIKSSPAADMRTTLVRWIYPFQLNKLQFRLEFLFILYYLLMLETLH